MKNFKNLKFIDDINEIYEFGEILGKGSFGSVRRAIRKGTNFEFAVKVIDKDSLNSNPMLPRLMVQELSIL
jgi:3-phosphoinositide dependent protein kinase-1